jgi:hypothetical protein
VRTLAIVTEVRSLVASLMLALTLFGSPALAQDASIKDACIDAYRQNQPLRRDGKLVLARSELLVCARSACPAALQRDCIEWLADVDARLPSVLLGATNAAGEDVADVHVTMDGREVTAELDGRPFQLDPGPHQFRFERAGAEAVVREIVAKEGEKARRIDVRLSPIAGPLPVPLPTHRPVTWPTLSLAIAGAAGLTTAVVVGVTGVSERSSLDSCKPSCPEAKIAPVRTLFTIADVVGGVSIGVLGVATVLFVLRPSVPMGSVRVGISPTGASCAVSF